MRSSCISHPEKEPLIVIRQWQLDFCKELGQTAKVGAALLSFFEYWHNNKLDMQKKSMQYNDISERHGDKRSQDESLYQFHTTDELEAGIMTVGKKNAIIKARKFLCEKGVISEHKNPNPKYKFDNTIYYLFRPEVAISFINSRYSENKLSSFKNKQQSFINNRQSDENKQTITEITTKITTKINKKADPSDQLSVKESENNFFDQEEQNSKPETVKASKKEKEKISAKKEKEIQYPFGEKFLESWQEWKEYKAAEFSFRFKSKISEQKSLNKLQKIAKTEAEAIEILNYSIENGYRGFFEKKGSSNPKPKLKQAVKPSNLEGVTEENFFDSWSDNAA